MNNGLLVSQCVWTTHSLCQALVWVCVCARGCDMGFVSRPFFLLFGLFFLCVCLLFMWFYEPVITYSQTPSGSSVVFGCRKYHMYYACTNAHTHATEIYYTTIVYAHTHTPIWREWNSRLARSTVIIVEWNHNYDREAEEMGMYRFLMMTMMMIIIIMMVRGFQEHAVPFPTFSLG